MLYIRMLSDSMTQNHLWSLHHIVPSEETVQGLLHFIYTDSEG